ncbi:MAG: Uma2 family endonuclease [Planctomycetes bacterium]|nr:Uma2 family endonuclease [Planctomycetota bacterium]
MSTTARLTLGDYDRMIAEGYFDSGPQQHQRIELIRGELHVMSPSGPPHENTLDILSRWSFKHTPEDRIRVRVQNSIGLPFLESAPEPDLAWVVERDYSLRRPEARDVLLAIEIADSSLSYDRGTKAPLYAEAGIADYWIVHVRSKCIEVFRTPQNGAYTEIRIYRRNDVVRPLCMPELSLRVADVFPKRGSK